LKCHYEHGKSIIASLLCPKLGNILSFYRLTPEEIHAMVELKPEKKDDD